MKNLVFLVLFISVFYLTSYLFPFIATSEQYRDTSIPNPHFSIAILENGKQSIVTWDKYSKNKNIYGESLVTTPSLNKTYINEFEFFILSSDSHDIFELDVHQDDYRFWSKYKIDNGEITPISFRYNGSFVIGYCILVSSIFIILIKLFLWLHKRRNKI